VFDDPAAPDVSLPATSDRATPGIGYEATRPAGWRDETSSAKTLARIDLVFTRRGRAVTVLRQSAPYDMGLDDLRAIRRDARRAGARDVTPAKRTELDGESTAVTFRYRVSSPQGVRMRARQVVVLRGGAVYQITLTATTRAYQSASEDFVAFLRSWRWTL
jgi:hypothetical protein